MKLGFSSYAKFKRPIYMGPMDWFKETTGFDFECISNNI